MNRPALTQSAKSTPEPPDWAKVAIESLPALATVPEVAEVARCSERTLTRAIARGELTAAKPAGRTLIPRAAVAKWIASRVA